MSTPNTIILGLEKFLKENLNKKIIVENSKFNILKFIYIQSLGGKLKIVITVKTSIISNIEGEKTLDVSSDDTLNAAIFLNNQYGVTVVNLKLQK